MCLIIRLNTSLLKLMCGFEKYKTLKVHTSFGAGHDDFSYKIMSKTVMFNVTFPSCTDWSGYFVNVGDVCILMNYYSS